MKKGAKIKIVPVDDHPIVRDGLAGAPQGQPDLSVIGEASDGNQAVDMIRELQPDVAIIELHMPKRRVRGIAVGCGARRARIKKKRWVN